MALNLEDKKRIVKEVAEQATLASSVIIADYRGLTANQMNDLRQRSRRLDIKIYLKVIPNNLTKIALRGTEFNNISSSLSGPLLILFWKGEFSSVTKLLKSFMEENKAFDLKSLVIDRKSLNVNKLEEISKIPGRNESLTLLCNILHSPVTNFSVAANEILLKVIRLLSIIGNEKK